MNKETIRTSNLLSDESTAASKLTKSTEDSIITAIQQQEIIESDPSFIAKKVMEANPNVEIIFGPVSQCLYSPVKGDELVVPENYYYNEKNGFTNKHRTKSGVYGTVLVRPLEDYYPEFEEL